MNEKIRLSVLVVDDSADPQGLDEATIWLRDELLHLDVVVSADSTDPAPAGSRAELSLALGGLVIALAGTEVLGAIVNAITAWLGRNQHRSVKLELDGDMLEVTGVSSAKQRQLVDTWLRRRQAEAPPSSGRRLALIVASDEYQDPGLRRLRAPAQDAEALAKVLGDETIGGFDVRTMLNEPTSVVNEAVEEFFADRHPDDLLLLHFSGHGVKNDSGDLYFATTSTKLNRLGATAVAAEFVNRQMTRSRCRRVVLLLDCCYAGAFARGALPRAGTSLHVEDQFDGRGRVVITASNALEYAFDGLELADEAETSPSVFTRVLVEGLESGKADRDQDGYVGVHELYDYVYDQVRAVTPKQTPGKWTFDVQGDLIIARRGRPVNEPTPLPSDLLEALSHSLAKIRLGAIDELDRLRRGRHAGLALAARLALEQLVDDDSRMVSRAATQALHVAHEASTEDSSVPSPKPSVSPSRASAAPVTITPSYKAGLPLKIRASKDGKNFSIKPAGRAVPRQTAVEPPAAGSVAETPSWWSLALRAVALVAAFLLAIGAVLLPSLDGWSGIVLPSPVAEHLMGLPVHRAIVIWAMALVVASAAVGLLREGRPRNAALGAAAGLGALELGLLAGLGGMTRIGDSLEPVMIMTGVVLILLVVFVEVVRSQPDVDGRIAHATVALLAAIVIVLLASNPFDALRIGGGALYGLLLLGAVTALLVGVAQRIGAGGSRPSILLGVVATLLLLIGLGRFPSNISEIDGIAVAYFSVLFVLLVLAAQVIGRRPELLSTAQVTGIVSLLLSLIIESEMVFFIVVLLLLAAGCAVASAYEGMSRK
ncbi:caspase family protein [Nonomuraea glycinis]|uniref:caspase family protein n=1 Tax=Nonomuraea glycinis TaxID=2047744 RepID=UPI0033B64B46